MIHWMIDYLLSLLIATERPRWHTLLLLYFLMLPIFLLRSNSNIDSLMIGDICAGSHHGLKFGIKSPHEPLLLLGI